MVAKLTSADYAALDLLSNLEEQIILLCQKLDAAQTAFNIAHPTIKRRVIELNSDFLSRSVVVQISFPLEQDSFTPESVGEIFPTVATPTPTPAPTPIPEPIPAPGAGTVSYVASQSSVSGESPNVLGTYTSLTDGNRTTGAGCGNAPGDEWIKATFSTAVRVTTVQVGGGYITDFGPVAGQLNGSILQYSNDDAVWTDVLTIAGVADADPNQFPVFTLAAPQIARYWRLKGGSYMATSEFKFT